MRGAADDDYAYDVTNQPGGVTYCHACCQPIEDDGPQEWDGLDWHGDCLPIHVRWGREQEARADEAKHEW